MTGSRAEALVALEMAALAALLLPWTWLAARRTPLPRVRARLRAWLRPRRAGSRLSALAIGRIVAGVGRRLPGIGTCLTQALVTEALLHREHHAARLVIGVERPGAKVIRAHAWVESAGGIVIGAAKDLGRFVPIAVGNGTFLKGSDRTFQRSGYV